MATLKLVWKYWRAMKPDRYQLWIVIPPTLTVAPLFAHLPLWISAIWGLCALLRLARRDAGWNKIWLLLLAALVIAGVLAEFKSLVGPQAGVALLVGMTALKILESDSVRDRAILAFVSYFLLFTHFIYGQGLLLAAYLGLVTVVLTATLMAAQATAAIKPQVLFKLAAILLAQAVPLALLLFVLFPRIPSPFSGLSQVQSAQTGLSDTMQPGSVSELIQSDAIAFRVEFEGTAPKPADLYWRGPVLWSYDGRTWRQPETLPPDILENRPLGRLTRYSVTLEPHQQRWLFTLGLSAISPDVPSDLTADMQWLARQPINNRLRYRHAAYLDYQLDLSLNPEQRALGLQLPRGYNPLAREMTQGWLNELGWNETALVNRALANFRNQAFFYTLRPPKLGDDAVDDFLFNTRRGFCEHYASAFVVLMRMAGLPARVVTGYQGAEFNPLGQYWLVRQRDAHAWAEVWLTGQGWVRVDPTAAVAPERVEHGIDAALPLLERPSTTWGMSYLRPLSQAWDALNNQWNQWVIGYDHGKQRSLMERLHPLLSTLKGMLWALVGSVFVILLLLFLSLSGFQRRQKTDPLVELYDRFRQQLQRIGILTPPQEGPGDLAARVSALRPDLAAQVHAIIRLYTGLRYGALPAGKTAALAALVRRFKPRRQHVQ